MLLVLGNLFPQGPSYHEHRAGILVGSVSWVVWEYVALNHRESSRSVQVSLSRKHDPDQTTPSARALQGAVVKRDPKGQTTVATGRAHQEPLTPSAAIPLSSESSCGMLWHLKGSTGFRAKHASRRGTGIPGNQSLFTAASPGRLSQATRAPSLSNQAQRFGSRCVPHPYGPIQPKASRAGKMPLLRTKKSQQFVGDYGVEE